MSIVYDFDDDTDHDTDDATDDGTFMVLSQSKATIEIFNSRCGPWLNSYPS